MDGGAWPFLVGGVICLVNSDNERDSPLLTSRLDFAFEGVVCSRVFGAPRACRPRGPHLPSPPLIQKRLVRCEALLVGARVCARCFRVACVACVFSLVMLSSVLWWCITLFLEGFTVLKP